MQDFVAHREAVHGQSSLHGASALGAGRSLVWPGAFVLSLGGALLVTVSLGPMAGEMGPLSAVVWILTAFIGLAQCLMIAELASCFPDKLGGVPAYNHEGLKHLSPLFGAVSSWSYWVGWMPGVAVNLTLAATYIRAAFLPDANVLALTLLLVIGLYALNYFGLQLSVWTSSTLAVCALVPLLIIISAPLIHTASWNGANFWPLFSGPEPWDRGSILLLLAKWMFVAVWSSYGAEMVASILGEMRHPDRDIPRVVGLAAMATLMAFAVVPTVLVGVVGVQQLAGDPYVVFLTLARQIFGPFGSKVVCIMLVAALILGAQLFVICSSRALFQMSKDGLGLKSYTRTNRYGVPVGSVGWDALITLSLLAIFKDDVVNVVAAANVGYLLVFVLMPLAYVLLRTAQPRVHGSFTLPRFMTPVAWLLLVFNLFLLLVGGVQWGPTVICVGVVLVLPSIPFYAYRRLVSG